MNYIRPFDTAAAPAFDCEWLLAPSEGAGCAIRLCRGGGDAALASITAHTDGERYALILAGEASLVTPDHSEPAAVGELIFIPAGVSGTVTGDASALWAAIEVPVAAVVGTAAKVISVDQSRFEGNGFGFQVLIDRSLGAHGLRINALQVQPGSGSPDFHIHAFTQVYIIQEGEITVDIGRARFTAGVNSIVYLPAGVVHRNFNASGALERHVSLLVPEPSAGAILDYAVTIHEVEAQLLTTVPAPL